MAFRFSFLFGYYIGRCIVSSLLYKTTKKLILKLSLRLRITMQQQQQQQPLPLATNSYIPKKPEKKKYNWFEHDLMKYIDDLKYEHFFEDTDSLFSRVKIRNFDIIHHQCCGEPLQNSVYYYETICNRDFKGYEDRTCNPVMLSAIKAERNDIHFKDKLLKKHIRSDIIKYLTSNGFL